MNLSPVVPASPTPAPADSARATDSAGESGFDNVLAQQKGHAARRSAPAAGGSSTPAHSTESDERQAQTPEETLALLAAGAILPWTAARANGPAQTGADAKTPHAPADGQALAAGALAAAGIDPQSSHKALADQAPADSSIPTRIPPADLAAGAAPTRATDDQPFTVKHRIASGAQTATSADVQGLAGAKYAATQDLLATATRPSAQAPDTARITDPSGTTPGTTLLQGTSLIQASAPVAPAVTTPLSSPNWAADFSRQFIHLAQGRDGAPAHTAELRLDPPGLGPVRITLQVGDSITHVSFVSPHAVVRQAIENALPQLQQQLDQAGLSLGQANVSDQSSGQQGFEHAANSGSGNGRSFSLDGIGGVAAHDGIQHSAIPRTAARLPDALVDTFA